MVGPNKFISIFQFNHDVLFYFYLNIYLNTRQRHKQSQNVICSLEDTENPEITHHSLYPTLLENKIMTRVSRFRLRTRKYTVNPTNGTCCYSILDAEFFGFTLKKCTCIRQMKTNNFRKSFQILLCWKIIYLIMVHVYWSCYEGMYRDCCCINWVWDKLTLHEVSKNEGLAGGFGNSLFRKDIRVNLQFGKG